MNTDYLIGLTYADRLRLATTARHESAGRLFGGKVTELTSLMGPMGENPNWPAGPAWLAARHGDNAYIISDGLSDPWVERDLPETGLGLEVYMASADTGITAERPLTDLADSWLFPMTAEISHTLAANPGLCRKLLADEPGSLEFNIEHIKDGRGRTGVLLDPGDDPGMSLNLPGGPVKLVSAILLTLEEMRFLRGKGRAGRLELTRRLTSAGYRRLSLLHRPSVV